MAGLFILVLNSGSSSIKFSVFGTGDGEPQRLHEGAVDGIGTDQGEFWIKDNKGKKLVDESPALPTMAAAFKLVADALHSKDFPAPSAIGHRMVSGGPTVQTRPSHHCTHLSPSTSCAKLYGSFPAFPTLFAWTRTFIATCPK
jgi:acetate kinase